MIVLDFLCWVSSSLNSSNVLDAARARRYVFGGITLQYGLQASMYRLDMATRSWTRIVAAGAPPDGLYGHSSVLVGSTIWIFGGALCYSLDC